MQVKNFGFRSQARPRDTFLLAYSRTHVLTYSLTLLPRAGQVDAPEQGGHHGQERYGQGGGDVGGRRQARQEVRVAHGGHQGGQRLRAPSRQAEKVSSARAEAWCIGLRFMLCEKKRFGFLTFDGLLSSRVSMSSKDAL
eukprot:scaffold60198_cov60-Phaeocystis_antarctica.AAC.2